MASNQTLSSGQARPNYGMDAPGFIYGFLISGILLTGAGGFALSHASGLLRGIGAALCLTGAVCLGSRRYDDRLRSAR